ncbi:hypothetical protein OESDEN_15089 [Oesophagostomum dentatum]|uniref:Uncharacterized protein n=1 Tax=Oesophagostomum dentatum TaxID=61180 RepID=A0A0B1SJV2_OESDE|nr:hypothetical protein OESDEN_15089 [Oesophagostomum dentatum]
MAGREALKKDEAVQPLLKEHKDDNKEQKKAGQEKRVKIVIAEDEKKKAPKTEAMQSAYAPSQSTQSMSPESRELYPPDQIKVLHLNDIMDETNSQSISKAPNVRNDEGKGVFKAEAEPEKVVLDQVCFVNVAVEGL